MVFCSLFRNFARKIAHACTRAHVHKNENVNENEKKQKQKHYNIKMLTLKLITDEKARVIAGLNKKHFPNAEQAIDEVIAVDKKRRESQQELDACLSEQKKEASRIGMLMKQGDKEAAEKAKAEVAALKEKSKELEEAKAQAEQQLTTLLCQIPNIPYDEVPEGKAAEDNRVVKSNLKECTASDTVGNWDVNPSLGIASLTGNWQRNTTS